MNEISVILREVLVGLGADSVLFNDALDEFPDSGNEFGATLIDAERVVKVTQPREIIGPVESAEDLKSFPNHVLELPQLLPTIVRRRVVPFPEHAPHDVVQGSGPEVLSQGHRSPAGLLICYVEQHGVAILLAAGLVCYNAPGGEEVGRGDLSQESPVWSVGRKAHGAGEHKTPRGLLYGAVSEVRGGEDFPGSVRVRGYNSRSGAEAEGHELSSGRLAPSQGG